MTDTNKTFGEVLGRDLAEIKKRLDTVVEKASSSNSTDQELRDILLEKRDAFLKWFEPKIENEMYILSEQDKDLISRSIYSKDIIEKIKADNKEQLITGLFKKDIKFISHPTLAINFISEIIRALDEKYSKPKYATLLDDFRTFILDASSTDDSLVTFEVFDWWTTKLGYRGVNLILRELAVRDIKIFSRNKNLFNLFRAYAGYQSDGLYQTLTQIAKDNPDLAVSSPFSSMYQRTYMYYYTNNDPVLLEKLRKSLTYRMHTNYWDLNYGNESFWTRYLDNAIDYTRYEHTYLNDTYTSFTDSEFQLIFDQLANGYVNSCYFVPLFVKFPLMGYTDLYTLSQATNNNKPITNFKLLYEKAISPQNTKLSAEDRNKVKLQFDSLAEQVKYLRDDSPYLERVKKVFDFNDSQEKYKNMCWWWNKISFERYTGIGTLFLFMMDSGDYNEFFKLITDIPGIEDAMKSWLGNVRANSSNSDYLYTFIPWIATNRLERLKYRTELEKFPLFQTLKSDLSSSDFNNYWAVSVIAEAMSKKKPIDPTLLKAIKKIKDYKTKFLQNIYKWYQITLELVDEIEISNDKYYLRDIVNNVPSGDTLTLEQFKNFSYKNNIRLDYLTSTIGIILVEMKKLSILNFNIDLPRLCKSDYDRENMCNHFGLFSSNAQVILDKIKSEPTKWKFLEHYSHDTSASATDKLKALSNNYTKPVIVFFSLGTYRDTNPDNVVTWAMAPNSSGDNPSWITKQTVGLAKRVVYGNNGIQPNTKELVENNLSGVWFGKTFFGELGDGYVGINVYEYIGG